MPTWESFLRSTRRFRRQYGYKGDFEVLYVEELWDLIERGKIRVLYVYNYDKEKYEKVKNKEKMKEIILEGDTVLIAVSGFFRKKYYFADLEEILPTIEEYLRCKGKEVF